MSEQGATEYLVKPLPALANHDRLVMTLNIHHEHRGDQPTGVQAISAGLLETMEQPFQRRFKVGSEWQELDLGWLKPEGAGYIVVANLEGQGLLVHPSKEEREEIDRRVIMLSFNPGTLGCILVSPGWAQPLRVDRPELLYIKSAHQEAWIKLTVFPK